MLERVSTALPELAIGGASAVALHAGRGRLRLHVWVVWQGVRRDVLVVRQKCLLVVKIGHVEALQDW